jgi:hypothetical protein
MIAVSSPRIISVPTLSSDRNDHKTLWGTAKLSHIVTIGTEVRDAEAVRAACRRLGLDEPVQGTVQLFSGEATGLAIKLPGWLYHIVSDPATGQVNYDNYEGRWGDQKHLDAFLQAYAISKATIEARKRGHSVYEQPLPDGSVKLTIQVAGGVS